MVEINTIEVFINFFVTSDGYPRYNVIIAVQDTVPFTSTDYFNAAQQRNKRMFLSRDREV